MRLLHVALVRQREELLNRCSSIGVFHGSGHVRSCLWKDRRGWDDPTVLQSSTTT